MSDVILLDYYSDEIARIELRDETSRNTFSDRFVEGLHEVFAEINQNTELKVVVMHGYDNYFCCGGTKDELLSIANKKAKFTDFCFYKLLLECPIPCIAAMQGHTLGGGLAFSCYADMMILAEECYYATNFMKYGFTPGMGSTLVVPKKFGEVIAHEMFYTARNFQGIELKERGVPLKITPQDEVVSTAFELAEELADKPLIALTTLKKQLIKPIVSALDQTINEELAMHAITFTTPEVLERIERLFMQAGQS